MAAASRPWPARLSLCEVLLAAVCKPHLSAHKKGRSSREQLAAAGARGRGSHTWGAQPPFAFGVLVLVLWHIQALHCPAPLTADLCRPSLPHGAVLDSDTHLLPSSTQLPSALRSASAAPPRPRVAAARMGNGCSGEAQVDDHLAAKGLLLDDTAKQHGASSPAAVLEASGKPMWCTSDYTFTNWVRQGCRRAAAPYVCVCVCARVLSGGVAPPGPAPLAPLALACSSSAGLGGAEPRAREWQWLWALHCRFELAHDVS